MKNIIIVFSLFFACLSLSAGAESFRKEFYLFNTEVSTGSKDRQYAAYVRFSKFLADFSLKTYSFEYVVQNKTEVLNEILSENLKQLKSEYNFTDLECDVKKIYRDLVPGFCLCLMELASEQQKANSFSPKF